MWEEREFLVCAKTYPEYSSKYTETVCTVAVLRGSGKLIRLYPISYRYLAGEQQFRKYQWVKARIRKNPKDNRPESHTIKNGSIRLGQTLGTEKGWLVRKQTLLGCQQINYTSLEDLQEQQQLDGTSLGIIRPKSINGFRILKKSESEIAEGAMKQNRILSQRSMVIEKKKLEQIPYWFLIHFNCDHPECTGHHISILDWEFGQLYRNVMGSVLWKEKIERKIDQICSVKNEVYFFMGNLASRRQTFCILGIFYPPKPIPKPIQQQLHLFQ